MCNCKRYKCSLTFEVVTSSANVNLPESNRLRNSKVVGVAVMRAGGATLLSPNGATLATDAVVGSAYLNLTNVNGTQLCPQLPLSHLMRDYNAPDPLPVNWTEIDPTQTSLTINTGASGYNAAHVVMITFFLDCDNCGVPD